MLCHIAQGLLLVAQYWQRIAHLVIRQFGPAAHDDALCFG